MSIYFRKKPKISLRIKAILAMIVLGLLVLGTFVFLGVKQHHAMMEEEMKKNYLWLARTLATSLSPPLHSGHVQQIASLLDQTIQDEDVLYLIVRDSDGSVIFSRHKAEAGLPDLGRGDFKSHHEDTIREIGSAAGLFHEQGHIFEITQSIRFESKVLGWLQLGIHTVRLNRAVADATYWGIRVLVLFFLIGAVAVALIDRKVKQNLTRLIKIVRRMSEGDFSQRVQVRTGDDLEELGKAYNKMADALRERDARIQKHEEELEKTVAARTGQLQDEQTKLKAILDHVPSGFLLLDKNMRIQMASTNFEQITGRTVSELLGKCCTLSLWNDGLCETCATERCLRMRSVTTEVVRVQKKPERLAYFEHIAIPIMKKRRIEYVLEIITDITQRRLLQEQMIRAERLAATGEMAAVIAHEMRNSLTSVNMILQLLLETATESNLDVESIQVALEAIRHTESVVNQLLQFSRPKPLQKHPADLNQIVRECVAMTEHQFRRRGIELQLQFASNLPLLEVDAERIKEALVNLLLNAEQALDGARRVHVKTGVRKLKRALRDLTSLTIDNSLHSNRRDDGPFHEIVIPKGARSFYLEVCDSGCGIIPQHLGRVFDPFFTTKVNGTGLGLPLVKRIVNEHGGVVEVKTQTGKGSVFTIILPLE